MVYTEDLGVGVTGGISQHSAVAQAYTPQYGSLGRRGKPLPSTRIPLMSKTETAEGSLPECFLGVLAPGFGTQAFFIFMPTELRPLRMLPE